tara:strand:- start:3941 stop:4138 length:198 start_codon:yes stop_codon:yes gene_type:complete
MWMVIILLCSSPMAKSCVLITGEELYPNKEKCFEVSIQKAEKALTFPQVYQAKPFCQIIPNGEKT